MAKAPKTERPLLVPQESVTNFNEAEFISQSLGGDTRAYSAIVEFYQERAIRIAYSFLGNWEDARDSAQEAFISAFRNLKNFKAESRFYTWFYRILANECKDFLRKKKVRGFISIWTGIKAQTGEEPPETKIAGNNPDALKALENKELGEKIYLAIRKLPFQQQSAFSLRYLEGLSMEEIADHMNLSVGAVKAHLWQAGRKVREILKKTMNVEIGGGL